MKKYILAFLLLLPLWLDAEIKNPEPIKYIISYSTLNQEVKLIINLKFKGNIDGSTTLILPHSWAWQNDFQKGIKNIKTKNKNIQIIPDKNYTKYKINHLPSQNIEISYEVVQYWDQPIDRKVYYRPIINNTYFHFIGHGFFIYPEWKKNQKRKISIEWRGIKKNWILANSFNVRNKKQVLDISINHLCHAAYMAGDFVLNKILIKNHPIYIIQRGKWKFTQDNFNNMIESVVKSVRDFWNDYNFPYFLVTLIPTENTFSMGGTGLTNSFETFVSTDHKSVEKLKFLLTHELFHTWNGRKIQREEPEELVYWFSEGFTNYYTRLILLRYKLITFEEYISDYNKTIKNYYFSPVKNISNEKILKDTHNDSNIEKMPYLRGDLLATKWNALIKTSTNYSLDHLMFDLLSSALKSNKLFSAEIFNQHIKKYLKSGIKKDIIKYVNQGRTIIPGENDLGPCVELIYKKMNKFDLGFKFKKLKNKKGWSAVKVIKNGPAFKAGLRVNDRIIGRSIYWNNIEKQVSITIKNKDREKKYIRYFPLGKTINVPQYQKKNITSTKHNCIEWFKNK